ncbi:MAG: hypothetical protein QNJ12_06145 [Ilumatobacter sp.]|uniref:hypothetical protein n=1 Tax=Ilumatobacter sp. TaxID=1967498 RepID=UPI00260BAE6A|nr:hypothetical protein [Ilumatobacter sp.]MDJ0768353.1 hypothetical protein [Ilumatobacter sp.]
MIDLSLPPADLYIAALGRSGSTMLANLLTTPPTRWLIVEPRFANATTGRDVLAQARSVGIAIGDDEWPLRVDETPEQRIGRIFRDRILALEKWGVKEVRHDVLVASLDILRPKHTIVLVRDLRDVAVSLYEKARRDDDPRYDDEWLRTYLTQAPGGILAVVDALGGRDHRIVRYEDLTGDAGVRAELGQWLDWPLDGRPDRNLAALFQRAHEVELHDGAVTRRSVGRHASGELSPGARSIAAWAHRNGAEFQDRFGYG